MKSNAKRILSFMLAVILCACMVVVPVSAEEHNHDCKTEHVKENGTFVETREPVCGDYGYTIYECNDCGHYFATDIVKPTGTHTAGELVAEAVKATCTTDGKEAAYKCVTCGKECDAEGGTVDVIAKGDGTHNIDGLEPVKVVDGTEYYICADCGEEVTVVVACPEGTHVWGKAPTSVTFDEEAVEGVIGTATYTCVNCPVTKTVDVIWDHACTDYLTHVDAVVPEHCEAEGNIEYWHCEFCGTNYADKDATTPVENVENNGKHSYDDEPTVVPATCTTYGFTFYACTVCGEQDVTKTIVHKPLGHNNKDGVYVEGDAGYAATCEKDGYTGTYNCDACGVEVKGEVIKATGHDYKTVTVAKTCSVYGYTYEYCANTNCDHDAVETVSGYNVKVEGKAVNYKPESLVVDVEGGFDADAHTLVEVIINAATCTAAGSKYYYCQDTANCSYYTEPVAIPATGHNHDTTKGATIVKTHSEQTCTTAYVVDVKCADCDNVKTKVTLKAALGHDTAKATLQTKLPTCKVDGKTYKVCATCSAEVTVEVLKFNFDIEKYYATEADAKKDHAGLITDEYTIDRIGSCTIIGLYRYECADCDHAVLVVIDGTGNGHVADETVTAFADGTAFKPAKDATCTEDGYTGDFFCKECKEYFKGIVIKATGHTEKEVAAKAPTCTADGFTKGVVCETCEEVLTKQETIPATGHNWAPAAEGYAYVCGTCEAVCNHTDAVVEDSRVADCTLFGYKHYVCDCGYEYVTDYVAELGHTSDEGVTTDATCTEDGATVYSCTVCGTVLDTDVIPATGHKNEAGEAIVESCTDTVEDRFCVNCETTIGKACTNLYGTEVAATCTEYGYVLVVCKDCGNHTIKIDATKEPLTHSFTKLVTVTVAPTPATKGEGIYECVNCGEYATLPVDFTGTELGITVSNEVKAGYTYVNGSKIKVSVTINTEKIAVWGLDLDISFSAAMLTFDGAVVGETFANDTGIFGTSVVDNTKGNVGKISVLATANNTVANEMINQELEGEVVVVDLYFTVKSTATNANIVIGAAADMMDVTGEKVSVDAASATIKTGKLLDVTGEGNVNMADLNAIMQIFTGVAKDAKGNLITYSSAADTNFNGVIDVDDIKAIMTSIVTD